MHIKKKYLILIIIVILILLGLFYFWKSKKPEKIWLSGRLEGYESDIGAKVGGRVDYVFAREGAKVRKGLLVVRLDDSDLQAQLQAANANIEISQKQQEQAEFQVKVIEKQLSQAKLSYEQSKDDFSGAIGQAKTSVSIAEIQLLQAQEQLKQAESDLKLAAIDYKRYSNLSKNGSVSKHTFDNAKNKYEVLTATKQIRLKELESAKKQIEKTKSNLVQINSTKYNPDIKKEQVSLMKFQLMQAKSQFESTKSSVKRYNAEKSEILAQIAYLYVKSPIDGVIIARTVEPGEIVNAGKTMLTLLNYDTVYLRGYIPEGKIGLIRIGQKAKVYLDSAPKEALNAYVSEIDSEASFTPENIYFRNDRVKQVFGLKLNITNPQGYAKPGMPADAEILLDKKRR